MHVMLEAHSSQRLCGSLLLYDKERFQHDKPRCSSAPPVAMPLCGTLHICSHFLYIPPVKCLNGSIEQGRWDSYATDLQNALSSKALYVESLTEIVC